MALVEGLDGPSYGDAYEDQAVPVAVAAERLGLPVEQVTEMFLAGELPGYTEGDYPERLHFVRCPRPQPPADPPAPCAAAAPTPDAGVGAAKGADGKWRWSWRAPWASQHYGTTTHKSERAALAAGRRWVAEQQGL